MAQNDVEAQHTILVTDPENRNIAAHVVYTLNKLLRCLRHFRAVGEGEIARDLLLQGDRRGGTGGSGFGVQSTRVDFNASNAKQPLRTATQARVQSLAENGTGGLLTDRLGRSIGK